MTAICTHPSPPVTDQPEQTGPMARVVLASLGAGAVGAAALTLGAFPGAREHTITGATLLAFGAGWGVLSAATSRFTNRPQRWARVPATVMATTGAALLVLSPDEDGLRKAGWVWPVALVALALWCIAQVRVAMRGQGRWLVLAVLSLTLLAGIGGFTETLALAHDKGAVAMPGQRHDVGGRALHLTCGGSGSPTVVLMSGSGEMSSSWARIASGVAATTRVCAYDRAGQGWSDDAPHPQDAIEMASDLHRLLQVAGEHGPFVITGHSLGGPYAMTFAARYPSDTAGLVLLDASSPWQFTDLPEYPGQFQMIRRLYSIAAPAARLGIGRLFSTSSFSSLPQPAAGQVRAFQTTSRALENVRDDASMYRTAFRQAGALTSFTGKPLVVLTAAGTLKEQPGWDRTQAKLAQLSPCALHTTADTTHAGMMDEPVGASAATKAVLGAVSATRAGSPCVS
jgi:pimeloyl-ACP methyl ester carboxylesterase